MHTTILTKSALAHKLGICRQSLYYKSKKDAADETLRTAILAIYADSPWYGHRRLAWDLAINKKRVLRVMKKFKIHPVTRKTRPDKKSDKNNPPTATPNIAKTLCPIRTNVLWAGDFTYLSWHNCFVYVATVLDMFTREIVGWHVGLRHTTDLIIAAFLNAAERTDTTPTIFHSDQGSEYVSGRYEKLLQLFGTKPSNSTKGSPWQNGYQESFYNNFKLELGNPKKYQTLPELVEAIHLQIAYYNTRRLHTALKTTPQQFREQQTQKELKIQFTKNLHINLQNQREKVV